jgi:hypothetical protein
MEKANYRRDEHKATNRRIRLNPDVWEWIDHQQKKGKHHSLSETVETLLKQNPHW